MKMHRWKPKNRNLSERKEHMGLNLNYEAEVLVETEGLTREQWLDYRKQGIGGSDCAAIMGFSRSVPSGTCIMTRLAYSLPWMKKKATGWQRK